ncbi:hypothetical protein Q9R32_10015 [Actinotalea sp. AC32]|nr:hypothetical protein [Actinotalea sp. AC32]
MPAIRCSCILDERLRRVVADPTCPATLVHELFHAEGTAALPEV